MIQKNIEKNEKLSEIKELIINILNNTKEGFNEEEEFCNNLRYLVGVDVVNKEKLCDKWCPFTNNKSMDESNKCDMYIMYTKSKRRQYARLLLQRIERVE